MILYVINYTCITLNDILFGSVLYHIRPSSELFISLFSSSASRASRAV